MPLTAGLLSAMREKQDRVFIHLRILSGLIEDHMPDEAWAIIGESELDAVRNIVREMSTVVGPTVNAAERAAEEYHQLREELEEEYTSGRYKPA